MKARELYEENKARIKDIRMQLQKLNEELFPLEDAVQKQEVENWLSNVFAKYTWTLTKEHGLGLRLCLYRHDIQGDAFLDSLSYHGCAYFDEVEIIASDEYVYLHCGTDEKTLALIKKYKVPLDNIDALKETLNSYDGKIAVLKQQKEELQQWIDVIEGKNK